MLDLGRYIPGWTSSSSATAPSTPAVHSELEDRGRRPLTPPRSSTDGDDPPQPGAHEPDEHVTGKDSLPREEGFMERVNEKQRMRYDAFVRGVVEKEYPQLRDLTYLDTSASPPAPHSLLTAHIQDLSTNLYTNPHSRSPASVRTGLAVEGVRERVLREIFGIGGGGDDDGWELVFTSGATAGLKLVGECFDWDGAMKSGPGQGSGLDPGYDSTKEGDGAGSPAPDARGQFVHLTESHTSLVGVRDLARRAGADVRAVGGLEQLGEGDSTPVGAEGVLRRPGRAGRRLIGIPAQCNATGRQYISDLSSIQRARDPNTYILLDAAAYLTAHRPFLDLSSTPYADAPDFIVFSFYKMFGYPTGLGGLVVKRSAAHALSGKIYFGGGTLDAYTPGRDWKIPRGSRGGSGNLAERFEDGTINYQAIVAIPHGLRVFDELFGRWEVRRAHVDWLTGRLFERCAGLRHANGREVVRIYSGPESVRRMLAKGGLGPDDRLEGQGATLNLNVLTSSGSIVPPTEVDRLACIQNIHLREGRHCNAGVITEHLGVSEDEIVEQYRRGYGCDDLGTADGSNVSSSIRVSLGVFNTSRDVDVLVSFLERFFLERRIPSLESEKCTTSGEEAEQGSSIGSFTLSELVVYPIKSCAGQRILPDTDWPLTPQGLQHDREWVIINLADRKILSQKRHPRMALVRPRIDLAREVMTIMIGDRTLEVDISRSGLSDMAPPDQVCGQDVRPTILPLLELQDCLTDFLGVSCALARQIGFRHSKLGHKGGSTDRIPLLLSNESPFLLINQQSVDEVSKWMATDMETAGREVAARASSFRANFVISPTAGQPARPFLEDDFEHVQIGDATFAALGRCRRCQMVAIDQDTGEKTPGTFLALAKHRRGERSRIHFGQHLTWLGASDSVALQVGMEVKLLKYR